MTVLELKIQSLALAVSACGKVNSIYTPEEIMEVARKLHEAIPDQWATRLWYFT